MLPLSGEVVVARHPELLFEIGPSCVFAVEINSAVSAPLLDPSEII